ncbi:MAG: hypothetical protein RSE46_18035, partial [Janthinobacterium sp.]
RQKPSSPSSPTNRDEPFFMPAAAALHRARKEKQAWEVEERQELLPADKATLADETTEVI